MKNFYEATVTKPDLKLDVKITLTPIVACPCIVLLNGEVVYDGTPSGVVEIIEQHPLTKPISLKVIVTRQHPEAVTIDVDIDENNIIPLYQQLAQPQTNYLDFNGEWALDIPNFYPWYHSITGQGWIA